MSFLGFGTDEHSPFNENKYNPNATAGAGNVRQSAGPNLANDNQYRAGQMSLANSLSAQANGGGPNPAALQMHQGMAQNASNAMALAASGRSSNPGMSAYHAAQGIGAANQQAANAAGQLRLAQMLGAQQNLAGLYGQGRAADQAAAGMGMQNGQFNAGQYNAMLGQDVAAQNAMRMAQNQQIYGNTQNQNQAQQSLAGSLMSGLGAGLQMIPGFP